MLYFIKCAMIFSVSVQQRRLNFLYCFPLFPCPFPFSPSPLPSLPFCPLFPSLATPFLISEILFCFFLFSSSVTASVGLRYQRSPLFEKHNDSLKLLLRAAVDWHRNKLAEASDKAPDIHSTLVNLCETFLFCLDDQRIHSPYTQPDQLISGSVQQFIMLLVRNDKVSFGIKYKLSCRIFISEHV